MAEYFTTRSEAEQFIQDWYPKDNKRPIFVGRILNHGLEKWIVNYDAKLDPRSSPFIKVLEDLSGDIPDIIHGSRPQTPTPSTQVVSTAQEVSCTRYSGGQLRDQSTSRSGARFAAAFVGGFTAVLLFMIVAGGLTAVLMALGFKPPVAGIIGVSCWYGLRYLAREYLKNKAS